MTCIRNASRIGLWLLLWGVLDFLCAMFCEIHADEAYYRLYGQFLAWGYFDHPPMVGLMAALSNAVVPAGTGLILKNLSVRLVTVLMHVATMWIVWQTLEMKATLDSRPSTLRFLLIAASMPMFCAYGFITTPDAPLLFFAALFYYAYRRYLSDQSWNMAVLLGISMAGMLYSKYIAVLVMALTVAANWRLLKDVKAWVAIGITTILMLPHLWWQYTNNFPSFTYHLVSRATAYEPFYTLEFIPNQWAVFNPLVWALMLWLSAKALRSADIFRRTAAWTIIGFQIFFLLISFRGHVEPHWTMVTSIPAIFLIAEWEPDSGTSQKGMKLIKWGLGVFAGLLLIARVVLMMNILPPQTGMAGKQAQMKAIHEEAQGLPVVFDGSFQTPSLYRFFYDDQAVLVRNAYDRYTQYDLLHLERDLIGQPACVRRFGQVYTTSHLAEEDLHE